MKVLVTGGAGFIGSHIAETCAGMGAEVVILDNLDTGSPANLQWKAPGQKVELVQSDVRDAALITKLIGGCDWVFHQAAIASVPYSVAHPIATNEANLSAVLTILVAARDAKVKRVVFASSSAIYGENPEPAKVETLPPQPLTPYALQKYGGERYAQLFHSLYGLETVSLRYFNVFGPRQSFNSPYSGVIAKFCTTMLEGKAPTIFGDGLQSRDFVYIKNVVNANLLAAQRPADAVAGKVFNIGGGESINLLQLAEELNKLTGQKLSPQFQPARTGDVRHSKANIAAAQSGLGYQVEVSWQEGLRRTLDFYRGQ
jgi:UDP-glucose 4-epimerase